SSVYCIRLQPASPTLFPYTPLFRSTGRSGAGIPGGPDGPRPARFRRGGINTRPDLGDPIDRKAALAGVFADQVGIGSDVDAADRSEEHTSELQSRENLVCRLLLEKK